MENKNTIIPPLTSVKISEIRDGLKPARFNTKDQLEYYKLDKKDNIVEDINVFEEENKGKERQTVNLNNLLDRNFRLNLHVKNGILDRTITDHTNQELMMKYKSYKPEVLTYDTTITFRDFKNLQNNFKYPIIEVKLANLLQDAEYSISQIFQIISLSPDKKVFIHFDDTGIDKQEKIQTLKVENEQKIIDFQNKNIEPSFTTNKELINDWITAFLYQLTLRKYDFNNLEGISLNISTLKNLIVDSKYYNTIKRVFNIPRITLFMDEELDDLEKLKLSKYNIDVNGLYICEPDELETSSEDVDRFIEIFKSIKVLIAPDKYKNKYNNVGKIIKYNKGLFNDPYLEYLIINKEYNIFFNNENIIEFQTLEDKRFNLPYNDPKCIITVDNEMKYPYIAKFRYYKGFKFVFLKDYKYLPHII